MIGFLKRRRAARAERALRASIAHWEENLAAETPDQVSTRSKDCALCQEYASGIWKHCGGCPVFKATGYWECYDTPYYNAATCAYQWAAGFSDRDNFRTAAQAEIDFLKSLLPEGK